MTSYHMDRHHRSKSRTRSRDRHHRSKSRTRSRDRHRRTKSNTNEWRIIFLLLFLICVGIGIIMFNKPKNSLPNRHVDQTTKTEDKNKDETTGNENKSEAGGKDKTVNPSSINTPAVLMSRRKKAFFCCLGGILLYIAVAGLLGWKIFYLRPSGASFKPGDVKKDKSFDQHDVKEEESFDQHDVKEALQERVEEAADEITKEKKEAEEATRKAEEKKEAEEKEAAARESVKRAFAKLKGSILIPEFKDESKSTVSCDNNMVYFLYDKSKGVNLVYIKDNGYNGLGYAIKAPVEEFYNVRFRPFENHPLCPKTSSLKNIKCVNKELGVIFLKEKLICRLTDVFKYFTDITNDMVKIIKNEFIWAVVNYFLVIARYYDYGLEVTTDSMIFITDSGEIKSSYMHINIETRNFRPMNSGLIEDITKKLNAGLENLKIKLQKKEKAEADAREKVIKAFAKLKPSLSIPPKVEFNKTSVCDDLIITPVRTLQWDSNYYTLVQIKVGAYENFGYSISKNLLDAFNKIIDPLKDHPLLPTKELVLDCKDKVVILPRERSICSLMDVLKRITDVTDDMINIIKNEFIPAVKGYFSTIKQFYDYGLSNFTSDEIYITDIGEIKCFNMVFKRFHDSTFFKINETGLEIDLKRLEIDLKKVEQKLTETKKEVAEKEEKLKKEAQEKAAREAREKAEKEAREKAEKVAREKVQKAFAKFSRFILIPEYKFGDDSVVCNNNSLIYSRYYKNKKKKVIYLSYIKSNEYNGFGYDIDTRQLDSFFFKTLYNPFEDHPLRPTLNSTMQCNGRTVIFLKEQFLCLVTDVFNHFIDTWITDDIVQIIGDEFIPAVEEYFSIIEKYYNYGLEYLEYDEIFITNIGEIKSSYMHYNQKTQNPFERPMPSEFIKNIITMLRNGLEKVKKRKKEVVAEAKKEVAEAYQKLVDITQASILTFSEDKTCDDFSIHMGSKRNLTDKLYIVDVKNKEQITTTAYFGPNESIQKLSSDLKDFKNHHLCPSASTTVVLCGSESFIVLSEVLICPIKEFLRVVVENYPKKDTLFDPILGFIHAIMKYLSHVKTDVTLKNLDQFYITNKGEIKISSPSFDLRGESKEGPDLGELDVAQKHVELKHVLHKLVQAYGIDLQKEFEPIEKRKDVTIGSALDTGVLDIQYVTQAGILRNTYSLPVSAILLKDGEKSVMERYINHPLFPPGEFASFDQPYQKMTQYYKCKERFIYTLRDLLTKIRESDRHDDNNLKLFKDFYNSFIQYITSLKDHFMMRYLLDDCGLRYFMIAENLEIRFLVDGRNPQHEELKEDFSNTLIVNFMETLNKFYNASQFSYIMKKADPLAKKKNEYKVSSWWWSGNGITVTWSDNTKSKKSLAFDLKVLEEFYSFKFTECIGKSKYAFVFNVSYKDPRDEEDEFKEKQQGGLCMYFEYNKALVDIFTNGGDKGFKHYEKIKKHLGKHCIDYRYKENLSTSIYINGSKTQIICNIRFLLFTFEVKYSWDVILEAMNKSNNVTVTERDSVANYCKSLKDSDDDDIFVTKNHLLLRL